MTLIPEKLELLMDCYEGKLVLRSPSSRAVVGLLFEC